MIFFKWLKVSLIKYNIELCFQGTEEEQLVQIVKEEREKESENIKFKKLNIQDICKMSFLN